MVYWSPMIILLRLIHILAGVFWTGAAIMMVAFFLAFYFSRIRPPQTAQ